MKLEHQVCALEQAKKLDELGVKAESYFVWFQGMHHSDEFEPIAREFVLPSELNSAYPAYSCAELWKIYIESPPALYCFDELIDDMNSNPEKATWTLADAVIRGFSNPYL